MAFSDVIAVNDKVRPIVVIRAAKEQHESDELKYALGVLREVSEIVDWADSHSRVKFLDERQAFARAA